MKYIILLGDGMPDYPIESLSGKTPLQAANTPNMDFMAREGSVGAVKTVPKGFTPGSDVTNLAILGYDTEKYYTGRAPLEAASLGVDLKDGDIAFRCNLVTLKPAVNTVIMDDFSAGHIKTEDARPLIMELNEKINNPDEFTFYPGISYRHLMVWRGGKDKLTLTPPHDISDDEIKSHMPKGEGSEKLIDLMSESQMILTNNKVNAEKKRKGEKIANSIWLWGHGKKPTMPSFLDLYKLKGSIVAAVDLMKGIGICAGLRIITVPGATGYLDTNFEGKADAALKALEDNDFVYLHVEAPDEAGHNGSINQKIKAIEDFDSKVVGRVLNGIKKFGEYRILLVSDHRTPVSLKTHSEEEVPFAIYPRIEGKKGADLFSENILSESDLYVDKGHKLIELLLNSKLK